MQVPTRLRLLRMAHGLTQMDLAIKAGVQQVEISRIENARVTSIPALLKVAAVFDEASPERLVERTWDLKGVQENVHGVTNPPSLSTLVRLDRQDEAERKG